MQRKIFLFFILISISVFSYAQPVQFAIFAGPQATSAHYTVNGIKQPTQYKYGAFAGVGLKVPFDNQLYFFPAVYYSLKGYKVTLNNPSFPPTEFAKNNNTTIHTIEVSPLFQIDFSKRPSHFALRFGPAVDFVFAAKEKFDTVSTTGARATIKRPMIFSFGDYGRITASVNLHFGYETERGVFMYAYYVYGLGSLNNADGGPHILHRIVGVSIGWYFRKKL